MSLIARIFCIPTDRKTDRVVKLETARGAGSKLDRLGVFFANGQVAHACSQELSCRNELRNDLPASPILCQDSKVSGVIRGIRERVL